VTYRVLVPLDDSEPSWRALEFAIDRHPDAQLVLLHVIVPVDRNDSGLGYDWVNSPEELQEAQEDAVDFLAEAAADAEAEDVDVSTYVATGKAAGAIVEATEERDVDQVVMGSHGRSGVKRIVVGSVAEQVMRNSPVPVTVVR